MRFQPLCCQNMRTISAAGAAGGALALAPPPGSRAGRPFGEPRELLGVPVRSDARGTARAPPAPAQHFSAKISLFSMCRGRSKREASDVLSAKGGRAKKAASGGRCRATTARGKSPPPSSADRRTSAMPLLASAELTTDLPRRRDDAALLQSRESPDDRPPAPRARSRKQASPFSFVVAALSPLFALR